MIELDKHIEILLLSNDCVMVPSLGGFMTHHIAAHYDEEDNLFLPPTRTLGFNPQLNMNDSLLAQSYAEAYDLSYPEAVMRIEKEVAELKQILEEKGKFVLNDLGTLSLNEEGKYTFEPFESGILTPNLYGLYSFSAKRNFSTNVSSVAKKKIKTNTTHQDSISFNEDCDINDKTISIRVSVLRNVLAAAIAIIAFFIIAAPAGPLNEQQASTRSINTQLLLKIMPKDVTNTGSIYKLKESTNSSKQKVYASKKNDLIAQPQPIKDFYCIVLASRITNKNAETYAEKLREKGFESVHILKRSNGAKVVYGQYKSESSAYKELNKLHDLPTFSNGWVMHVK